MNINQYTEPITETPLTLGELRNLVNRLCDLGYEDMSVRAFHQAIDYQDGIGLAAAGGLIEQFELRISPVGAFVVPQHLVDEAEDYIGEALFTLEEVEEVERETK